MTRTIGLGAVDDTIDGDRRMREIVLIGCVDQPSYAHAHLSLYFHLQFHTLRQTNDVLARYVDPKSPTCILILIISPPAYVDTNLVGSGKIHKAAIIGLQGGVWASSAGYTVRALHPSASLEPCLYAHPTALTGRATSIDCRLRSPRSGPG